MLRWHDAAGFNRPARDFFAISKCIDTSVRQIQETCKKSRRVENYTDLVFEDCPKQLAIFFVPGGPGISGVLQDGDSMKFVMSRLNDQHITSVCTGSLVLGAAGLLSGYKATTHWMSMDLLQLMGVHAISERVVVDGNRITGAGVTSGIDFALQLASVLFGSDCSKEIQLQIEYNPNSPFHAGHPDIADRDLVERTRALNFQQQEQRKMMIRNFIKTRPF